MKQVRKTVLAFIVALVCFANSASAQIVVRVRPPRPAYVRVAAPSPRHVWVDEEWVARGNRYEWAGGRWVEPPHAGMVWIPGHWRGTPSGDVWIAGRWRRH